MEQKTFALKGNIIYTKERTRFEVMEQGWLVCEEGRVRDVYSVLPEELKGIPVEDMEDRLIIPGLTDLHIHAPQYTFRSLGNVCRAVEKERYRAGLHFRDHSQ